MKSLLYEILDDYSPSHKTKLDQQQKIDAETVGVIFTKIREREPVDLKSLKDADLNVFYDEIKVFSVAKTFLGVATFYRNVELVRLFLEKKANPNLNKRIKVLWKNLT